MSLDGFQPQGGNHETLTFDQRELLENTVLPTARKWLKMPGLQKHGESTLAYWGELPRRAGGAQ